MKSKAKIFNLSAISIIACDCLQAVIGIFIDLFFVSKILNVENPNAISDNILKIGLFYIILYSVLTLCYTVTGHGLKRINKSIFVSIGAILLTVVVLMVYLMGERVGDFVPLIAMVYGIAFGFFSSGFHNLTAETISSKHQVRFFAVKRILYQATYIIVPISLGFLVDKINNFSMIALIMLAICAFLIMFSFFIKPKKVGDETFMLRKFSKYLKKNKEKTKPLLFVYISNFFRGASFDCFTTLITILVMITFKSNSLLGMYQSIFTAASLITMFFYLKFYRKKRATKFIVPTIVAVACTIIGIFISTSKITIVLFTAVYSILNVILMSISDSRRSGVVRVLSLHSHVLEHTAFSEFFLGAGRVISSILILCAGVFDSMMGGGTLFLKIVLGIVAVFYVMYGVSLIWVEKSLIKQDEQFKKEHANETIEKTED